MSIPVDSVQIVEGITHLLVPPQYSQGGPGKRVGRVFFNAQMAFNRDVSVMFFQANRAMRSALDGMSSTGSRAVRWSMEARPDMDIVANDRDPEAVRYIEANIALNRTDNVQASNEDVRCLLARRVFDYIDIDPFGTPVPFIPAVMQGAKRFGTIGVTATDTAPLSGTYPKKCLRRYGAWSARSPFMHETGLRILIGHLAREAGKEDRGIECQLCFYADHYFRAYLRLVEGGGEADRTLERLGYVNYDPASGERSFNPEPLSKSSIGPLWGGPLHNKELLENMKAGDNLEERERCAKYLQLWRQELDIPYYFENDELASMTRESPPPMDRVLSRIGEVGKVSRTHFSPTGFKTDLPLSELLAIYSGIL